MTAVVAPPQLHIILLSAHCRCCCYLTAPFAPPAASRWLLLSWWESTLPPVLIISTGKEGFFELQYSDLLRLRFLLLFLFLAHTITGEQNSSTITQTEMTVLLLFLSSSQVLPLSERKWTNSFGELVKKLFAASAQTYGRHQGSMAVKEK